MAAAGVPSAFTVERFVPEGARFPAHSHDEFVISVNGSSTLREKVKLDRHEFEVGSDAITVYNPGEIQGSRAETRSGSGWECFSVHLEPDIVTELTGIAELEVQQPIVTDPFLAETLRSAAQLSDHQLMQETVTWVISEALHQAKPLQRNSPGGHESWRQLDFFPVVERMRSDLTSPADVSELAQSLSLSPDYFIRSFVKLTGMTPYAWHLQLRLREGRRRLKSGAAATVVAAELGFSDQSHFHRHFRAAYAQTPGQFRRRAQEVGIIQD
ncbi:AraC family transcriptional regulator [Nesterenkonia alba]|uniref:AraC family transcriptional regulator n=1 Tax=Nesterenkonia alba TaxID=515814 RepID=UPI0003B36ECC|nr:AraC family transcriptional regulator [Nesterenkonia alba]